MTLDEQRARELAEQIVRANKRSVSPVDTTLALLLPLICDQRRLEYVYSGKPTTSDALVELEIRLLNNNIPTMPEVRAAIDKARGET